MTRRSQDANMRDTESMPEMERVEWLAAGAEVLAGKGEGFDLGPVTGRRGARTLVELHARREAALAEAIAQAEAEQPQFVAAERDAARVCDANTRAWLDQPAAKLEALVCELEAQAHDRLEEQLLHAATGRGVALDVGALWEALVLAWLKEEENNR